MPAPTVTIALREGGVRTCTLNLEVMLRAEQALGVSLFEHVTHVANHGAKAVRLKDMIVLVAAVLDVPTERLVGEKIEQHLLLKTYVDVVSAIGDALSQLSTPPQPAASVN